MSRSNQEHLTAQGATLDDFELLAKISQMLTLMDRDHVLEQVIDLSSQVVGAERSSLMLNPEHSQEWNPVFFKRQQDGQVIERLGKDQAIHFARRVIDKGLAGWVVRNKQGVIVADTERDERWIVFPDGTSAARSALCVPFIYDDDVLGVLTLLHSEPNHFTEHHLRLMTIVANQATVAVRNALLFDQMERQKRQLEAILHAMPDTLLVLDDAGRVLLVNDAGAQILGSSLSLDDLRGRALSEFLANDSVLGIINEIVATPIETGQSWSFEARSEQLRHDYLVTVSVWENTFGGTAGYVVVMRDITTLRDLNRFKDEMLQMASHDLRSPLALIVGYCSLIALDTPEDSPIQEYLEIIQKSTERMKSLLDDLLRVEQIRNSPLEMNEQINFRDLVQTAVDNLRLSAANKGHQLTTELSLDGIPGIMLNPVLIRESMENLINNAIKYTPSGGKIVVRSYHQDDRVHFVVEDNGVGIPKAALPRIFQSFYRARQPGTENVEGRGLGLSLVKTIINRHHGEVWVESEEGKGSRFGFWLPISRS